MRPEPEVEVEEPHHAALGQRQGEGLEQAELARRVAAADHRADGAARDDVRLDAGLLQHLDHADMRPAPGRAAAERQADAQAAARRAARARPARRARRRRMRTPSRGRRGGGRTRSMRAQGAPIRRAGRDRTHRAGRALGPRHAGAAGRPGRSPTVIDAAVEAGAPAGVAAAAVAADLDADQQGVLVAIDPHLDDALDLPAGGALVPELAARARPVPGLAGLQRAGQRLGVHVGDHQHLPVGGVDGDAGDEAVRVEAGREGARPPRPRPGARRREALGHRADVIAAGSGLVAHEGQEADLLGGVVPEHAGELGGDGRDARPSGRRASPCRGARPRSSRRRRGA